MDGRDTAGSYTHTHKHRQQCNLAALLAVCNNQQSERQSISGSSSAGLISQRVSEREREQDEGGRLAGWLANDEKNGRHTTSAGRLLIVNGLSCSFLCECVWRALAIFSRFLLALHAWDSFIHSHWLTHSLVRTHTALAMCAGGVWAAYYPTNWP